MVLGRGRKRSIALAVLATVLTLASTVLGYVNDRVFDADAFAGLVREALDEPEIRNYLADEVADAILDAAPDAAAGGTAIRDLTATLLEADFAQSLVEVSARDLHRTVFDDDEDSMLLFVSDLAVTVRAQLELVDPDLAALIPEELDRLTVDMGTGDQVMRLAQIGDDIAWLASLTTIGAVIALVATVWIDLNRWRGLGHAGLAIAMAGGLSLVVLTVGDSVLRSATENLAAADAIDAGWEIFTADLTPWAWTLIVFGGLVCAISWSLLRVGELVTPLERIRDLVMTRPETAVAQAVRAAIGLVLAIWLILDPISLVTLVGVLGGILLGIASARELLRVTGIEERLGAMQPIQAEAAPSKRGIALLTAGIAIGLFALAAVATAVLTGNEPAEAMDEDLGCNGHVELCPRRLDQVAMAATHNSMSAAESNFLLANHTRGIRAQLDAGYRGLLIDTWYGQGGDGGLVLTRDPSDDEMDPEAVEAAERVRSRITGEVAEEAVYLCHGFCEIGALDAVEELRAIHSWLVENPREVLVIFVQDATAPEDTAAVFEEAGLADLAVTVEVGTTLPTLDEMITAGRRVFVMVEEDGGDIPWLHDGFTFTQETPFSFRSADDFTCDANRGLDDSPLFQVNHFITPALGRNGVVNDLDVLLPRLQQCREERGLLPNLVSIDFWEQGDTLEAVDVLNGLD
ncbi:MAG: hypothetical protein AAF480_10670 [Actinomycetota bacterium]